MKSFNSINWAYLPRPATDGTGGFETLEEALQVMNTIPISELRQSFQVAFGELLELVEKTIRVKQLKNRSMTGPVFAEYLRQAVKCINASEIRDTKETFPDEYMELDETPQASSPPNLSNTGSESHGGKRKGDGDDSDQKKHKEKSNR